jgi:hypothetical protein
MTFISENTHSPGQVKRASAPKKNPKNQKDLISAGEGGGGGGGGGGDKDGDGGDRGGYINDEDANQESPGENDTDSATCVSSGDSAKRALQACPP